MDDQGGAQGQDAMSDASQEQQALGRIRNRIRQKEESYRRYNFSQAQDTLLRTFFDLAQEYDSMEDFYRVCVLAPREFLEVDCRLYLLDDKEQLRLVCDSQRGLVEGGDTVACGASHLSCTSYLKDGSFFVPIHRKPSLGDTASFSSTLSQLVMGMLEIFPADDLSSSDRFFLRKYSNRIGYNLHNRLIAHQNIRHLKFINNLVMDIEHNVITPNIYFMYLFKQLQKRIKELENLEELFKSIKESKKIEGETCAMVLDRVAHLHDQLVANHRELIKHHANYSLFLESLFRRDHFQKGHFVLRPQLCAVEKEIITPQLEHYASRFQQQGIKVEVPKDMMEEEIPLRVDVGLLSQVYANLFSNALKYTAEIQDREGRPRKAMAYGREILPDYFGPGQDGIKFNVFTTGKPLPVQEAKVLYSDGFRGAGGLSQPGTGHGLAFVRQVVEIHGGIVGYEATEEGNNFYFILPLSSSAKAGSRQP